MKDGIKVTAIIAVIGPSLFGCGGGGNSATVPVTKVGTAVRIMPLGDSITMGYNTDGGYRRLLEADLTSQTTFPKFQFVGSVDSYSDGMTCPWYEGHSGWAMLDFIGEKTAGLGYPKGDPHPLTTYVRSAMPDIILLQIGTNDGDATTDEFVRRYRKFFGQIYSVDPNVKIVAVSVLPKNRSGDSTILTKLDAAERQVIAEYQTAGKTIVAESPDPTFNPATMTIDGVHPTTLGYELLEKRFLAGLQSLTL